MNFTARQLRTGNQLLYNGNVATIESIHEDNFDNIDVIIDGICHPAIFLEPEIREPGEPLEGIPLTKEWFNKTGWKKDSMHDTWDFGNSGLQITWGHSKLWLQYDAMEIPIKQDIKFLHQLQNLYFALTGEELIINNHA